MATEQDYQALLPDDNASASNRMHDFM
nr:hypothetical protein [Klebsiella quasipneumoniae]